MTQFTDAPIFDADQHMYETPDALTRHLPERYRQAVPYQRRVRRAAAQQKPATAAAGGIDRWPFELAWVQLAYGERLRRARAVIESRVPLMAALETFERLGAWPWANRAGHELRAAGEARPRADAGDRDALTPQEHEIAMLAAAGLSNKEIGQRLFLSHRTVGNHLMRIFRKLSITSRAALHDALASLPPEQRREQPGR